MKPAPRQEHRHTPSGKIRARGVGVPFVGMPGPCSAITDVAGVEVGYQTMIRGDGPLVVGQRYGLIIIVSLMELVKENQYYMNVNHYTIGIKCTGLWRGKGFSRIAYLVSKNDSDIMDSLVIDSRWCEIVSPKGLLFSGPYLKTGAPRCDILFNNRLLARRLIREKHGLPKNAKIVMYAPTFLRRVSKMEGAA